MIDEMIETLRGWDFGQPNPVWTREEFLKVMTDEGDAHFFGELANAKKTGIYFSPQALSMNHAHRSRTWAKVEGTAEKLVTVWTEIDAPLAPTTRDESIYALCCQLRRLGGLMEHGLPTPTAIVLSSDPRVAPESGRPRRALGRSLHVFWRLADPFVLANADTSAVRFWMQKQWSSCMKSLAVAVGGDPICLNEGAVGRLGGVVLPDRTQSVLHLGDRVPFAGLAAFFSMHDAVDLLSAGREDY